MSADEYWDDQAVLALRPPKNQMDPWRPYAFFVEDEPARGGAIEPVATLFLTNRECPFRCLMCDLWKNTTDQRVPAGAIPAQIEWTLERLPPARHIKLYNAGNFFDAQAIPPDDFPSIARLIHSHKTVIVECHPRLVGDRCLRFRDLLSGKLEIAMGLETVHPHVLPRLNKRMTTADFQQAARFLTQHDIAVRAFILLRPPYLDETEGVYWAKRSIEFAFNAGVECCAVIPTRAGNGVMELLARQGLFAPPRVESLEEVIEYGLGLCSGRVLADLWDIERFCRCRTCGPARARRLQAMNLTQHVAPPVVCQCGDRT
jgi:archaeosine synthase beta-subunit